MAITTVKSAEVISVGDIVYVDSSGFLRKAIALDFSRASAIGLALDSGSFGDLIRVNTDSIYDNLNGLTPGDLQYLSVTSSGAFVNYAAWASGVALVGSGVYLTTVGRSVSISGLEIEISRPIYIESIP